VRFSCALQAKLNSLLNLKLNVFANEVGLFASLVLFTFDNPTIVFYQFQNSSCKVVEANFAFESNAI
jgi:hypothetical protein